MTEKSLNKIRFKKLSELAHLPVKATPQSNGRDLRAIEDCVIPPGETRRIPTGIALEMPDGIYAMVLPRSGMALKHQVTGGNAPGLIDTDYRGDVSVILINHGKQPYSILAGDKVGQLTFHYEVPVEFEQVDNLNQSTRNEHGFGHTGR